MLKAILKLQWFLGCLLCVFILIAAVDRVPDPPVVKPHRGRAAAFSLDSAHHIADQNRKPDQDRFDLSCHMRSVDRNWIFQTTPGIPFVPDLTRRASDSSPPISAL